MASSAWGKARNLHDPCALPLRCRHLQRKWHRRLRSRSQSTSEHEKCWKLLEAHTLLISFFIYLYIFVDLCGLCSWFCFYHFLNISTACSSVQASVLLLIWVIFWPRLPLLPTGRNSSARAGSTWSARCGSRSPGALGVDSSWIVWSLTSQKLSMARKGRNPPSQTLKQGWPHEDRMIHSSGLLKISIRWHQCENIHLKIK